MAQSSTTRGPRPTPRATTQAPVSAASRASRTPGSPSHAGNRRLALIGGLVAAGAVAAIVAVGAAVLPDDSGAGKVMDKVDATCAVEAKEAIDAKDAELGKEGVSLTDEAAQEVGRQAQDACELRELAGDPDAPGRP